jgi:release factor glutamine methyltransferase
MALLSTTAPFDPAPTEGSLHPAAPAPPVTFHGLHIAHGAGVLRPRPWTALQSRWARAMLDLVPGGPVLELCCGAGQIGLASVAGTSRRVVLVDRSPRACAWAHHNAVANGMADRVEVRRGRADEVLGAHELFPLVLADPPYLTSVDAARWPDDPRVAVDGGTDGMDVARSVLGVAAEHLAAGGSVLLQACGARQIHALRPEARRLGLSLAEVREVDEVRAVARFTRPSLRPA